MGAGGRSQWGMAAWSLPFAALAGWGLSLLPVPGFVAGAAATLVLVIPGYVSVLRALVKNRSALLLTPELLESTSVPLLVADTTLLAAHTNQAFRSLSGLVETRSRFRLDSLPEAWQALLLPHLRSAATGERAMSPETRLSKANGQGIVCVSAKCARIGDATGKHHVVVFLEDHTEADSSKLELQQRAEKVSSFLQRVIDVIPQPFYLKDVHSRLVMINRAYAAERGCSVEDLIGKTPREIAIDPLQAERSVLEDSEVIAGKAVFREARGVGPDGRDLYRLVSKGLCLDPDGQPVIVGANFNITQWRMAEQDLTAALKRERIRREQTQEFVQRLIDVIPHPVYVKHADGRLAMVNEAYASEWGVGREELIGRTVMDLAPGNPRAVLATGEDEQVLAHGRVAKEECSPHWTSGAQRWRIISKGACLDADGNTVIVGANFDITELRQLEREMQQALDVQTQTRAFLQTLFNALPNPVSVKDQHLRFIMTNEAWLQTFGMKASELEGVSLVDFAATRGGMMQVAEAERELLACPDGTVRESELSISHEFDEEQRFILRETVISDMDSRRAILCVYSDVSSIKAAEVESIRAREAAERANEAKSLFLANMSHELRTPMHAVLSFARLGQEKTASQPSMSRYHSYFERIVVAGERLMFLLDDLLDLSKLESGRANLDHKELDLRAVVQEALTEFSAAFGVRRQRVSCHFNDVSTIRGDAVRLGQVVRNLLSNACKYSPDGGEIDIYLHMAGAASLSMLELVVADTGIGIPEHELETVFDKFAQSSLTRTGAGGTGLGLAICREIVDLHGGEIFARNRAGQGAELVVRLPVGK